MRDVREQCRPRQGWAEQRDIDLVEQFKLSFTQVKLCSELRKKTLPLFHNDHRPYL